MEERTANRELMPKRERRGLVQKFLEKRDRARIMRARKILEEAVSIPETSLSEHDDLSLIGRYPMKKVRVALETVAVDVVRKAGKEYGRNRAEDVLAKNTSSGKLYLVILSVRGKPSSVCMQLGEGGGIIQSDVPLSTPSGLHKLFIGYFDRRNIIYASVYNLNSSFEEYSQCWKGFRWLGYNLLNWHSANYVNPEDLDAVRTAPNPKLLT